MDPPTTRAETTIQSTSETNLFSLPAELRLQIYNLIPLPPHGWFCDSHHQSDLRWLLSSRRVFRDVAPYCHTEKFECSLWCGGKDAVDVWQAFCRATEGWFRWGECGVEMVPAWLVLEARWLVEVLDVEIRLPRNIEGGECDEEVARVAVVQLLRGVERFEKLKRLSVRVKQWDWMRRVGEAERTDRLLLDGEREVWREWVLGVEEVKEKLPGDCVVEMRTAEFEFVERGKEGTVAVGDGGRVYVRR